MIISKKHAFIFFHIPKTGGTSVSYALEGLAKNSSDPFDLGTRQKVIFDGRNLSHRLDQSAFHNPNDGAVDLHNMDGILKVRGKQNVFHSVSRRLFGRGEQRSVCLTKHSTYEESSLVFSQEFLHRANKIVYVRSPYSRAYSSYRFLAKKSRADDAIKKFMAPNGKLIDLETFLVTVVSEGWMATKPQYLWYEPNVPNFEVLKTESMNESLPKVAKDYLGVSGSVAQEIGERLNSGRKNRSTEKDEWKSMSARSRSLIEKVYEKDFETFGF